MAALMVLHESKGPFSFAKENGPFGTPRERLASAVSSSKKCGAWGVEVPCVAALLRSPPLGVRDDLVCSYYPLPLSNLSVGAA